MPKANVGQESKKIGFSVKAWAAAMEVCPATVYNLLNDGEIKSIKVRGARRITTSPEEFAGRGSKK